MSNAKFTSRIDTPKGRVGKMYETVPNLCCPVKLIKRKIIQHGVDEAKLSNSFWAQEMEYVKPDFIWKPRCCHRSLRVFYV